MRSSKIRSVDRVLPDAPYQLGARLTYRVTACYAARPCLGATMIRQISMAAALLAFAGCGAGNVVGDDGLAGSESELSIDFTYDCAGYGASSGQGFGLHLKGSKAT